MNFLGDTAYCPVYCPLLFARYFVLYCRNTWKMKIWKITIESDVIINSKNALTNLL